MLRIIFTSRAIHKILFAKRDQFSCFLAVLSFNWSSYTKRPRLTLHTWHTKRRKSNRSMIKFSQRVYTIRLLRKREEELMGRIILPICCCFSTLKLRGLKGKIRIRNGPLISRRKFAQKTQTLFEWWNYNLLKQRCIMEIETSRHGIVVFAVFLPTWKGTLATA